MWEASHCSYIAALAKTPEHLTFVRAQLLTWDHSQSSSTARTPFAYSQSGTWSHKLPAALRVSLAFGLTAGTTHHALQRWAWEQCWPFAYHNHFCFSVDCQKLKVRQWTTIAVDKDSILTNQYERDVCGTFHAPFTCWVAPPTDSKLEIKHVLHQRRKTERSSYWKNPWSSCNFMLHDPGTWRMLRRPTLHLSILQVVEKGASEAGWHDPNVFWRHLSKGWSHKAMGTANQGVKGLHPCLTAIKCFYSCLPWATGQEGTELSSSMYT